MLTLYLTAVVSIYFYTWCGLGANLECRSEIQDAKMTLKNRHLRTIAQLCRAISSQRRQVSTTGKKLVKQQYLHASLQYGELRPTNGWEGHRFGSLGHPANFNGFLVLPSLLQRCRSPETNQTLHDLWPSPGLVHYTPCLKNVPPLACYDFDTSERILIFFWQKCYQYSKRSKDTLLCHIR